MYKPQENKFYSKSIDIGSCPSFQELISSKENLHKTVLEDWDGNPPVIIDDSFFFLETEDDCGYNNIVLLIGFSYKNINFETEMKEYEEWEKDQENIKMLQEQVKKAYQAGKKILKT